MSFSDATDLGTFLVAFFGVCLVVSQLRQQERAMKAEFGNLYVQRFWQIDDARILLKESDPIRLQHDRRYLRLFEDEFEVAKIGLLDGKQWDVWHGVLDDERARQRVIANLLTCDNEGAEFDLLRRCLAQRESEGGPHKISRCAAG